MNKEIIEHLSKDKVLKQVIDNIELQIINANKDVFQSLINSIIAQQISLKAAETIYYRLIRLFNPNFEVPEEGHWNQHLGDIGQISPQEIINAGPEQIKQAGLTNNKAKYIYNVAEFALEKGLSHDKLDSMGDKEVIEYLSMIKGVGVWTAEMICMFSLDRKDIFPLDDLSIRNGMIKLYNLNDPNPPKNKSNHSKELRKELVEISNKWKPYRSIACFYIWQYFETMAERTI